MWGTAPPASKSASAAASPAAYALTIRIDTLAQKRLQALRSWLSPHHPGAPAPAAQLPGISSDLPLGKLRAPKLRSDIFPTPARCHSWSHLIVPLPSSLSTARYRAAVRALGREPSSHVSSTPEHRNPQSVPPETSSRLVPRTSRSRRTRHPATVAPDASPVRTGRSAPRSSYGGSGGQPDRQGNGKSRDQRNPARDSQQEAPHSSGATAPGCSRHSTTAAVTTGRKPPPSVPPLSPQPPPPGGLNMDQGTGRRNEVARLPMRRRSPRVPAASDSLALIGDGRTQMYGSQSRQIVDAGGRLTLEASSGSGAGPDGDGDVTCGSGDASGAAVSAIPSTSSFPASAGVVAWAAARADRARMGAAAAAAAGDRDGDGGAYHHPVVSWRTMYVPEELAADLPTFAASVRQEAAGWHPLQISAALNHTVKLKDALNRHSRHYREDGAGGGPPRERNAAVAAVTATMKTVRQVLDNLYDALMPHISSISYARYAVNPLWVCAKMGYWGAPGSGFMEALLQRLRLDGYHLLQPPNGQTHGVLWWALSEYDQQQKRLMDEQQELQHGGRQIGLTDDGDRASSLDVAAEAAATEVEPSAAAAAAAPVGMDLLLVSASVLKRHVRLDPESFRPQSFCNIFLAAARLRYDNDPDFIGRLLENLVAHPGPFQPQDISNTVYALGELYGTEDDVDAVDVADGGCNTPTVLLLPTAEESPDRDVGRKDVGKDEGLAGRRPSNSSSSSTGGGGAAAVVAGPPARGVPVVRPPPALAGHARSLACLADMIGLDRFNSQALTNTLYGLARLGPRMMTDCGGAGPDDDDDVIQHMAQNHHRLQQQSYSAARASTTASAASPIHNTLNPGGPLPSSGGALPEDPVTACRLFVVQLAEHVRGRLQYEPRAFNAQDLGNATWALARLGYGDQSYYTVAVQAALQGSCMAAATPQNWAMFLWALVEVGHKAPGELTQPLKQSICGAGGSANAGSVAAAAASAASATALPPPSPPSPQPCRWSGDVRAWSSLPWLLACLGLYDTAVMDWVAWAAGATSCRGLKPHWISRSLWGLVVLPEGALVRHGVLVAALVAAVNQLEVHRFKEPELVQLWQSHVELEAAASGQQPIATSYTGNRITRAPSRRGGKSARGPTTTHDTARAAAATVASVGLARTPATAAAAATATAHSPSPTGGARSIVRHAESRFEEAVQGSGLQLRLRPDLVAAGRQVMVGITSRIATKPVTAFQRAIYKCLRNLQNPRMGAPAADLTEAAEGSTGNDSGDSGGVRVVRVEQEWFVEPLALCVDVCVWLSDGRVVAVEADGPLHFFANAARSQLPRAALRDRQLRRVFGGENVKCVPLWEWDALGGVTARRAYLTRLLGLRGTVYPLP